MGRVFPSESGDVQGNLHDDRRAARRQGSEVEGVGGFRCLAEGGPTVPRWTVRGLVFCGAFAFAERSVHRTWGDNSVSSLTVKPKVLALAWAHFLRPVPYLQRIQGVLDGVSRGPVGPPGPRGLS
jgi:hypothetical protein